jgi:hypothetical protein
MAEVTFLALRYRLEGVSKPHLSTHIKIHSSNEDYKAICGFSVFTASAYRLSSRKTTI